jgi:hypothetical protein
MKLIFEGIDFNDIKAQVLKFSSEHLDMAMKAKKMGRPKFTPEEHLGIPKAEVKEILTQVNDKLGIDSVLEIFSKVSACNLDEIKASDYARVVRLAKDYLLSV